MQEEESLRDKTSLKNIIKKRKKRNKNKSKIKRKTKENGSSPKGFTGQSTTCNCISCDDS